MRVLHILLPLCLVISNNFDIQLVQGQCSPLLKTDHVEIDYTNWAEHDGELIRKRDFQKKIYNGCGVTKTCISNTVDQNCVHGGSCLYTFIYGSTEDPGFDEQKEIAVELIGISDVWLSVAFGPFVNSKENIYQIECVKEPEDGVVEIWESYYNYIQKYVTNRLVDQSMKLARLINSSSIGSLMYCKFYIKPFFSRDRGRIKYDFKNDNFKLIMSRGHLAKHGLHGAIEFNEPCTQTVEMNETINIGLQNGPNLANRNRIFWHGTFMIVAFIGIIPIGGFYTRYFKGLLSKDIAILELPVWLWVHVLCEALAIFFMFKGIEYIRDAKQSSWMDHQSAWTLHQQVGILICAFHVAYFIYFSIFRTKTIRPFRWKFRFLIHQMTGHFVFILTWGLYFSKYVYLLNTTHWVQYSGLNCSSRLIIRIWTILYLFMHVLMTLYFSWVKNLKSLRSKWSDPVHEYELTVYNALFQPSYQVTNQPLRKFRCFLFSLIVLATFTLVLLLIFHLDHSKNIFFCFDKWYYFIL